MGELQTMGVLDNHKHSDKLNENQHTLDGTYGFEWTSLMWWLSKLTPNVPFQGTPSTFKMVQALTLNFTKWLDCHDFFYFSRDARWRQPCGFHVFIVHGRNFSWDGFPTMCKPFHSCYLYLLGQPGDSHWQRSMGELVLKWETQNPSHCVSWWW